MLYITSSTTSIAPDFSSLPYSLTHILPPYIISLKHVTPREAGWYAMQVPFCLALSYPACWAARLENLSLPCFSNALLIVTFLLSACTWWDVQGQRHYRDGVFWPLSETGSVSVGGFTAPAASSPGSAITALPMISPSFFLLHSVVESSNHLVMIELSNYRTNT